MPIQHTHTYHTCACYSSGRRREIDRFTEGVGRERRDALLNSAIKVKKKEHKSKFQ